MLSEGRARDMLEELFRACGCYLCKEITLEYFAEITERLAKEKLKVEGRLSVADR
ncbi:unnamed protein product [marine sediment metagenome]|uniref:Uncharacterized protein n=1 Tax=marine sediment metagenome TaxID=412755 RepID=X1SD61_9ZZZZ